MTFQFHGSKFSYKAPTIHSTETEASGSFRGRSFTLRKQAQNTPAVNSRFAVKYRGH